MSPRPQIKLTFELNGIERRVVLDKDSVLGREPDCDVVLVDRSVSRHHARLSPGDMGWEVLDLESANGTWVNGERVQRRLLSAGDCLRLGKLDVIWSCRAPAKSAPSAPERPAESLGVGMNTMAAPVGDLDGLIDGVLTMPAARPTSERESRLVHMLKDATETLLGEGDFDSTLERVMDLVFDYLPVERGFLQLHDEQSGDLVPKIERPARKGGPPARISRNVARLVVEQVQVVSIEDPASDERFVDVNSLAGIRAALCVPLVHEDRVAGVIYVDRTSTGGFEEADRDVLTILAKLAGALIERRRMRESMAREKRIRGRLSRYHAPAVVDEIVRREDSGATDMLAVQRDVSVLFCDIVGFTSMAERMEPSAVAALLSDVFEHLTDEVFEFGGTLDKFIGDAVMAFFGAPIDQPDHAERAVRAAIAMQRRMREFDRARSGVGGLRLRIGINTGLAVVGDIGARRRMDYSVIGDTVNVASRLESSVASAGQIVVGPETRARLGPEFVVRALDPVPLRNREEPIQPFLVVDKDA